MAERLKSRAGKPTQSVEALLESLREYTDQVLDVTTQAERQRARFALVAYGLLSVVISVSLLAIFVLQRAESKDALVLGMLYGFLAVSALGLPAILYAAFTRYKYYRSDLQRATERLKTTMSYASQIKDHMDFERLEEILMNMHLREADEALARARTVFRRAN